MTNKKTITSKSAPAQQAIKLDAATLSNMAHQPESPDIVPHDDDAFQRIADMVANLSPCNVSLVTNIIQVIVDQQTSAN